MTPAINDAADASKTPSWISEIAMARRAKPSVCSVASSRTRPVTAPYMMFMPVKTPAAAMMTTISHASMRTGP